MPPPDTSEHHVNAPVCDIDFFSDACLDDPQTAYAAMHAAGPVVWLSQNCLHAICGHSALTSSLRNHDVFQSGKGVSIDDDVNAFLIGSTLHSDPPAHDETRAITFGPLTPRALQSVTDQIEREAQRIADRVTAAGRFDAARDLAPYLPLTVVRDLVGLGAHGKDNMLTWAGATFEMMGDPRERRAEAVAHLAALRDFLSEPDVLDGLSEDGWANRATRMALEAGMPPAKAVSLMRDYIAPSLDTTISAIGYGVMLFARNPGEWDRLRADRTLMRGAIEEIVRLNTPIKTLSRRVEGGCEVEGITLPHGARVMMMFGAANRDPAKFPDPDRFDITRVNRGHVGFGHGVHACLGMHLARLEMTCLFNALADRVSRFDLTGDPVPARNSAIHAMRSVPVEAHA